MTKKEYINNCWSSARKYCEGVSNGSIVTNEDIRLAVKRHEQDLLRDDLEWRIEAVEKVFKFCYYVFIGPNKRFIPEPFQAFIILALFGFYFKGTDERRYTQSTWLVGAKNAKTTLAAIFQLFFMVADGADFPEALMILGAKDQTEETAFNALRIIIQSSPALRKRLQVFQSQEIQFKKDENGNRRVGKCKVMSGIPDKSEGMNPTSCILDEVHTWKDGKKFSVIKNRLGTKKNPMIFLISTAGFGKDSFCAKLVETGKNVLRGLAEDDRSFYLLYGLEEGDDPDDENVWIKANPGLGTILDFRTFRDAYITAKSMPSTLEEFIAKRLNVFLEEQGEWIPARVLKPCFAPYDESLVKDLPCYVGIDLSETQDLTSIVCLWDGGDKLYVKSYFFFVKSDNNALRRGNINIYNWVRSGYIIECKTPTIDYSLIKEYLNKIARENKVKGLYFDPWHFKAILDVPKDSKGAALRFEDGTSLWCVPVVPGARSHDYPMRFTESMFFNGKVTVSPNNCMFWNFLNVVKLRDLNGNFRPDKKKSKDAIDGVISLLNALYGYLGMNASKAALFLKAMNKT